MNARRIAALALLVMVAGCAHTTEQQRLTTAYKVKGAAAEWIQASYSTWRDFDLKQQRAILAKATTRDQFETEIAKWRAAQTKVDIAFDVAGAAVVEYGDGLAAYEAGKATDLSGVTQKLASAFSTLIGVLAELGVKIDLPKMGA